MNKEYFENCISLINQVSSERNYWIVRSLGGEYYDTFVQCNFISIGFNEVSLNEIKFSNQKKNPQKELAEIVKAKNLKNWDGKDINISYASSQLLTFCGKIKKGDIVMTPGSSSGEISIGEVMTDVYEVNSDDLDCLFQTKCSFRKRFDVEWRINSKRYRLNPVLHKAFNTHHIVTDVNQYSEYIDAQLYDFYRKDGVEYLILRVKQSDDITADDFSFPLNLIDLVCDFSNEYDLGINREDFKMKVCVQSPGDFMLFVDSPGALFLGGLFFTAFTGGKLEIEKIGLRLETKGLIACLNDFLDRRNDRIIKLKMAEKAVSLELDKPKDIYNALKDMNNPRNSY